MAAMIKRVSASVLWFLAAWAMLGLVAFVAALADWLVPFGSAAAAILVYADPLHLFWTPRPQPATSVSRRMALPTV